MKKLLGTGLLAISILGLAACGDDKASTANGETTGEETYQFTLPHAAAETHPFHLGVVKFKELVEEKSGGEIEIEIFPARQLGDEREGLENVINGTTEMALVSTPMFSSYTPVLDALQLPFLLNSYEIEEQAFQTEELQNLLDSLVESVGLKGLGIMEGGMRHFANNIREIKTPDDLKGLKLRTVETPLLIDVYNELGASPTPMAYGEVYTSLETGVLDGEEVNLSTLVAEKHMEVIDYVTLSGQNPFPALLLVNSDIFDTMSEEHQTILVDSASEAMTYLFAEVKRIDEEALKALEEAGISVTQMEDTEQFRESVQPVYDKYLEKDPLIKEFVEAVEALK